MHNTVINQLLHAPIVAGLNCAMSGWSLVSSISAVLKLHEDRFFDKHPVGRIMNRITMDMATIDLYLFLKISGSIMILFQTLGPNKRVMYWLSCPCHLQSLSGFSFVSPKCIFSLLILIPSRTMVPLFYIHSIMPLSMSVLSIPFYYVVGTLYCRYQNTTVPLRYCFKTSSSKTQSYLSDVSWLHAELVFF